ncbi:MAG: N-acetyltransferase [Pseudomonadota bacterium]
MSDSPLHVRVLTPADEPAVSALIGVAFGPGRYAKTAYRLREGTELISAYCRGAYMGERLVGVIRFSPVSVDRDGLVHPSRRTPAPGGDSISARADALLLGPLAIDPHVAGRAIGQQLMREGLALAEASSVALVILVGDLAFYERWGFERAAPGSLRLPGPVDPARLLILRLT